MDSLPPDNYKNYQADEKISCVINPNYVGPIPSYIQSICTGNIVDPWGPTGAQAIDAPVEDNENPPMYYVNVLVLSFGVCHTTLQDENLASLAGTIYSCDQSTGVFTIHKK